MFRTPFRPLAPVFLGIVLAASAPAPETLPLEPGKPRERTLAAGESQAWRAGFAAGTPVLVRVEQRGVDVVVEVSAPDGTRTAVDGPFDRQGVESLLVEPEQGGVWRIEVRAREIGAPPGQYEIRLEELAGEDDGRLAAQRAATRAGRLYAEGSGEARLQAAAAWREARERWRAAGDRREEARALYAEAVLLRLTGAAREALALGREVLPLWSNLGEQLWEGATWNEIGLDRWLLGETPEARHAFERAAELQKGSGDRYGEAASRSNLCLMALSRGALREGAACYERTIPLLREAGAPALEGAALTSAGRAWDVLGEPDRALASYRQALERMRSIGDRGGEARTLNHLGLLYQERGDSREAQAHLGEALETFRSLGDRRWQATVLHNLGLVYQGLGEWSRAHSSHEEALRLWKETGDRKGEADSLTNLGLVALFREQPRQALELQRQALELNRTTGDRRAEGITLAQLGRTFLHLKEPAAALSALEEAVARLHETGAGAEEAEALRSRGQALLQLGKLGDAQETLERALALARAAGHRASEAQIELVLAQTVHRLGFLDGALAHSGAALAILEDLRTGIGSPDLRASFSSLQHDAYGLHLDLLLEAHRAAPAAGHDRQALETRERARARTLLELLGEAGVDLRVGIDPALLETRASLLRRLSAKAERALRERPRTEAERAALEEERYALLRELDVVEAGLRERSPGYAALTLPQPLTAPGIQALLDPQTVLLVYALDEPRSALWAVTSKSVELFEIPGRAVLDGLARRLHQDLSTFDPADRGRQTTDAEALGRALLGPVADRLDGRRLVIVPDGTLEYLPFGALPDPRQPAGGDAAPAPLLQRHEIAYLPSASALAVQRSILAQRPPAPKRLAILADPVFGPGDARMAAAGTAQRTRSPGEEGAPVFERLPGSRLEAEAIAALAPPGESLVALDFDASRSLVLGERLSAFRTLHFATHGVIDAERPALSGLALSMIDAAGKPQEGFLHLHDIYNLRLDADLVVLSGCRTALGREVRGEGLIGLTRGFLYAGASRVVASLWRVEDQATAALMTRFYRALWEEGLPPAAALRAAQLGVREERRWRDPYYWAGFVLQGDWE
ncbi:MAG TPA: CHAT domain-containing protein [Thermoanaerobaculia bacterium]|nr:CHAT domain-containing protein [Thermoanaerobaculia bacterium]